MKPSADQDVTFNPASMYGSLDWVVATLGRKPSWFYKHKKALLKQGFPPEDTLIGMWIKEDVLAWVRQRRRIADPEKIGQHAQRDTQKGINHEAL